MYTYVYSVAQIWFTTSDLPLHGYSDKPHHYLLPVSMKYQPYDFICAAYAYFWQKSMISKQFRKGRCIFQALFIYCNILKYPHCSSALHLLKIKPKTFTNCVQQVASV